MRSAALVLFATLLALPAGATPTDFNFKDVELQNIIQTIAVLGRFNVIVSPDIARQKAVVAVHQVEPLDALYDVAKQNGLQVTRVRHEEGTTTLTYFIGSPGQVQAAFGRHTRTVKLRYASAAHVAHALSERIEAITGYRPSVDERTNRLILCGTEEALSTVDSLLSELDLPLPAAQVHLRLVTGSGADAKPLWSGDALATQGRIARVEVSSSGSGKGWKLSHLEGRLTARVSAEMLYSVDVTLGATLLHDGATSSARWTTEVQVKDGEETAAGTFEIAPGETVTLFVKPVAVKFPMPTVTAPAEPAEPIPAPAGNELDLDAPSPAPAASPSPAASPAGNLDLEGI